MHHHSSHHLRAEKRILKYISGTIDLGIHYHKVEIWLDIQIVIGLDHLMIERVIVDMCLI